MSNISNITDWINYELIPSLFERLDQALPELKLSWYSKGWRSHYKLNLSIAKNPRPDKTVITKNAPYCLLEQGGEVVSIINYIMRRDSLQFIDAIKYLADIAGLRVPNSTEFNIEHYQRIKDKETLLENINSYFTYLLNDSPTGGEDRDQILRYLSTRGYTSEEIKSMELGYAPSKDRLIKVLSDKGYSSVFIDEAIGLSKDSRIGSSHKLTIPYRSGGIIKGFKFRVIDETSPKYINSSGLDRIGGFFNIKGIKGNKDLTIVEGELDSLHATIKGIENVVATGGSNISTEQIKDALKRGAKRFTLCFDKETLKEDDTIRNIKRAIEIILPLSSKIFIAVLPDLGGTKTDPDRLIKESGVERFKDTVAQALTYYEYYLQNIIYKYGKIEEIKGSISPKDKDSLLDEVIITANKIVEPIHRDQFSKLFTSLDAIVELGITKESLKATTDRLKFKEVKDRQATELSKVIADASRFKDIGDIDKALDLIDTKIKYIKSQDKVLEFNSLLLPNKESEIKERLNKKIEALDSGYFISGEKLLLPAGAISIIAAPTSHGKTTFLINLALNVARTYSDKKIYFFSYEEDRDTILINCLNTFIAEEFSQNCRRSLKDYLASGIPKYINEDKKDIVIKSKNRFFKELIDTNRFSIHYSNYDSDTLIEAIRYLHNESDVGAIFIDYIQLLKPTPGKYKTYSRQEEVKEICLALKDVAVETGLPIILGAQFNREVTNQFLLHPTKIGEAGDIERVANLIIGFYNNNFVPIGLTNSEAKLISEKGLDKKDTLYAGILKQRGGVVNIFENLSFKGNMALIKNGFTIENTVSF
jgi:DNA primase catalytic core